jgi:hypothetical protein
MMCNIRPGETTLSETNFSFWRRALFLDETPLTAEIYVH